MRALRGSNAGRSSPGSTRSFGAGPPTTGQRCPADLLPAGHLHVAAHLQVGQTQPPEQVEDMGGRPLLRQVQQVQQRPMGVRRPRDHQRARRRRAPDQVPLDKHRPTPDGQRHGVPRRPRPDRILGRAAQTHQTPARQAHAAPARQAGQPVPTLRGPLALRRAASRISPSMGELVAARHPKGHPARPSRAPRTTRATRQSGRDQTRLVHASCQRALRARQHRSTAHQPCTPQRLA